MVSCGDADAMRLECERNRRFLQRLGGEEMRFEGSEFVIGVQ